MLYINVEEDWACPGRECAYFYSCPVHWGRALQCAACGCEWYELMDGLQCPECGEEEA